MFTKLKFILVIAVLCLTIPFSLSAKKPEKGEWSGFFAEVSIIDCGDYWILTDEVVEIFWIDFFDKDDNWLREFLNFTVYEDLYREDKPKHLTGRLEFHVQSYWENYEWVYEQRQGLFMQITVPGHGNMLFEAGRIMRDADGVFFEKGQFIDWDGTADFEPICNYLRQE